MNQKPKPPVVPTVIRLAVLWALYVSAGFLLRKTSLPYDQPDLFWPLPGLALASILILGFRFWPVVMLGGAIFLYVGDVPFGFFMAVAATGSTLAAVVLAFIFQRLFKFENAFERGRGVTVYVLLAGGLGAALNAAFSVTGLALAEKISWSLLWPNLLAWCIPNALALLVLVPFFIVWSSPSLWRWDWRQAIEGVLCVVGLATSTLVAIAVWFFYGIHNYPLAYLPVPFLLWATFRFGPRGATAARWWSRRRFFTSCFRGTVWRTTIRTRCNPSAIACAF